MPRFCTECGGIIEHIGNDPSIGCGGISYYECATCKVYFKEDQRGPFARAANLTAIHNPNTELALPHLLSERARKKDGGQ